MELLTLNTFDNFFKVRGTAEVSFQISELDKQLQRQRNQSLAQIQQMGSRIYLGVFVTNVKSKQLVTGYSYTFQHSNRCPWPSFTTVICLVCAVLQVAKYKMRTFTFLSSLINTSLICHARALTFFPGSHSMWW